MTETFPFVSIVMPIRNEAKSILAALDSLAAQDIPTDRMEIVIADGMSSDETRANVLTFQKDHPSLEVLVIDNPRKIVPIGLNLAIQASKGEFILRADGHTIFPNNYVRLCVLTLKSTNAANVGGRMVAMGETSFGKAAALATSSPFGIGGAFFHYGSHGAWVDSVYLGCWSREIFRTIGLFDEELVRDQDDEFNYRLRSHGGRIWFNPDIQSRYTSRSSPKSLFKQYFQYGFWKVRVLQKHPGQMSPRQFVPPVFVLSLLVSLVLSLAVPWAWWVLAGIVGAYLLANLTASLLTALRTRLHAPWLLPLAFSILHLAYGLGFLVGLVRFAGRWGDKIGKVPQETLV